MTSKINMYAECKVIVFTFRLFSVVRSSSDISSSSCSSSSPSLSVSRSCFFPFARVVTPQPPACSGNGHGSPSGTARLLSKTRANSLPVISKTGNVIAGKLAMERNTSTCKSSGRLAIFLIKDPNELSHEHHKSQKK